MTDAAIFYYPTGRCCIQLNITMQYSLNLGQMILTKHLISPNKNVSKCIRYLHWCRVTPILNTVFCLKNENKHCRSHKKSALSQNVYEGKWSNRWCLFVNGQNIQYFPFEQQLCVFSAQSVHYQVVWMLMWPWCKVLKDGRLWSQLHHWCDSIHLKMYCTYKPLKKKAAYWKAFTLKKSFHSFTDRSSLAVTTMDDVHVAVSPVVVHCLQIGVCSHQSYEACSNGNERIKD